MKHVLFTLLAGLMLTAVITGCNKIGKPVEVNATEANKTVEANVTADTNVTDKNVTK